MRPPLHNEAAMKNPIGAARAHWYVHVPFCSGKCAYCAFYSERYTAAGAARYLDALAREIDLVLGRRRSAPRTLYIGGGTPSILSTPQLAGLLRTLRERIDPGALQEWTIEANPGTLPPDKVACLLDAGVNRVSLGVQAFDDRVLAAMGRRHAAADVERTVRDLRQAGLTNIGMDLICGLPGVSDASWARTLAETVELDPAHVSVYALSVEPRTPLHRRVAAGRVQPCDETAVLRRLDAAERCLGDARFVRYEISNYARPGRRCRHHVSFWRGGDYRGFGPAAATRAGRLRLVNRPCLRGYLAALSAGRAPPAGRERLSAGSDAAERFVFAFRLLEGVNLDAFIRRFGAAALDRAGEWRGTLNRLEGLGLVTRRGPRWALTAPGRDLADSVARDLI